MSFGLAAAFGLPIRPMTLPWSDRISGRLGLGSLSSILTDSGPAAVNLGSGPRTLEKMPLALTKYLSQATVASAVTGVPSENFAPGRSVKSNTVFLALAEFT